MTYQQALAFLYGRIGAGIKVGTRNSILLARQMGNPHTGFPAIHIAGTSGKGSTASILESLFRTAGYTTGLYTSPHLHDFRERVRINGDLISKKEVTAFFTTYNTAITSLGVTYFEAITALAFHSFAQHNVDIALIETGLGGTHDATNIITPIASVITPISYDHTNYLGTTLTAIATEKAGIIKPSIPVISAPQRPTVRTIIRKRARAQQSPLSLAAQAIPLSHLLTTISDTRFTATTHAWGSLNAVLPIAGEHQACNARSAIATLQQLTPQFPLSSQQILKGLRAVTIRGRIQRIQRNPDIILDMAHNPTKMSALCNILNALYAHRHIIVVLGIMKDKDCEGIVREITHLKPALVITCAATTERAATALELQKITQKAGMETIAISHLDEAVRYAEKIARQNSVIIITGSIYTVAEAMAQR